MHRTILVTGGAVRIGAAISRAFAGAGWRVAIHCWNSRRQAAELAEELGNGAFVVQADLTVKTERDKLLPAVIDRCGGGGCLEALINNASVYRRRPMSECDDQALTEDLEINFNAPFQLMRAFRQLVGAGCIVNMLDTKVDLVDPGAGTYALAKKMLRDATEAAALEWAPKIRVNAVAPGLVLPPPGVDPQKMLPLLGSIPMQRATQVEEIAAACLFLVESPTITGHVLHVDGGLHLPVDAARAASGKK